MMGCDITQKPPQRRHERTTSTPLASLYGICGAQSLIRCNCGGGAMSEGRRGISIPKATPHFCGGRQSFNCYCTPIPHSGSHHLQILHNVNAFQCFHTSTCLFSKSMGQWILPTCMEKVGCRFGTVFGG